MKKLRILPLLLIAAYILGGIQAVAQKVNYTTLGINDGLSQISVLNILQDSKGFMWFATRNGLNRYDGVNFTIYGHTNDVDHALSDSHLSVMAEDDNGYLWVGTNQGLNKIDLSTGKITKYTGTKEYEAFDKSVKALKCDTKGNMLIGTSKGVFIENGDDFDQLTLDGRLDDKSIGAIELTPDGKILIGTAADGIYVIDQDYKYVKHYSNSVGNLPTNSAPVMHVDSHGIIWVGNSSFGFMSLDLDTDRYTEYNTNNTALPSNSIRCLRDDGKTLYIGTAEGLCTMPLGQPGEIAYENNNLPNFSVYSILIDRSGTRWVGTYSGGVSLYNPIGERLEIHQPTPPDQDYQNIYGAMDYLGDKLYVATEGNGLVEYDTKTGDSKFYTIADSHRRHSQNIIKSVRRDGADMMCGTASGEIYLFDTNTKRYRLFASLPKTSLYATLPMPDGAVYVATSNDDFGLVQIKDGKVTRTRFTSDSISVNSARVLVQDSPTSFLIGTRRAGLSRYDVAADCLTPISAQELGNKYITSILPLQEGKLYLIGTYGHGLYAYDSVKDTVKHIDLLKTKAVAEICQLVEDQRGYVWICTNDGIIRYQPDTNEAVDYNRFSQIDIQEFTPHSGVAMIDGPVAFASSNGFITFDPDEMRLNDYQPPIVFTGLKINNREVSPTTVDSPLEVGIDDTEKIRLPYNQNNIEISYAALNYVYPGHNKYAYRLKGVDDDWVDVDNLQSAHYANLAPGKYTFQVKGANNDGVWSGDVRTIDIEILPPWWKTWWAYTIYALMFLAITALIMYYIIKKEGLEQSLEFEKIKQQQAEEFHQSKLRMFTNFSHELRTPLTLIVSPLQELLKNNEYNAATRNKLSLIHNNSQRLLLLVNQLMDLHKNEAGKLQLKVAKDDICAFLQEVYCAFNQIASSKGIDLRYECTPQSLPAWFDKSTIEKVAFNLLSNAFKFTKEGGSITMTVNAIDKSDPLLSDHRVDDAPADAKIIHISVRDSGKGIPVDELENIFSPFYQVDDGKQKNTVGTGIGLSLTLSIVHLHHGVIWAENNQDGPGATFHVLIPNTQTIYTDEEIDHESPDRVVMDVLPPTSLQPDVDAEKCHTVLLVEDNDEVRTYVKECLSPYYNVLEAADGASAFDITVEKYPDIVVSDIMMPIKDGLELCSDIKNDLRTGHIPVILMTARSMVMHIKEGFATGADDYVVKPFNMDVLLYRIKNILDSREKLRNLYGKKFSPEALGIEIVSDNDKFTEKFFGIIEKNIDNPDLNINMICAEIGLSRANLYRKLKAITTLSPMELIRNKRLEVGAKLLLESDYSVSEISTYVGFNSHAYFTNCFKTVYGMSPSEFVEANRK